MKYLPLAVLALATLAIPLNAQTAPSTPPSAEDSQPPRSPPILQKAAALGLSQEQINQIQLASSQGWQNAKAIRANTALSAATKHEQLKANRRSTHEAILAVLTAAQRAKLKEIRESEGSRENPPETPPATS